MKEDKLFQTLMDFESFIEEKDEREKQNIF